METASGRVFFLKWRTDPPAGMYEAEADGLTAAFVCPRSRTCQQTANGSCSNSSHQVEKRPEPTKHWAGDSQPSIRRRQSDRRSDGVVTIGSGRYLSPILRQGGGPISGLMPDWSPSWPERVWTATSPLGLTAQF